jgi:hypothetical protein
MGNWCDASSLSGHQSGQAPKSRSFENAAAMTDRRGLSWRPGASPPIAHRNFSNHDKMIHFLKNVAMAGGFIQLTAFGAGGWSLDARRSTVALHRNRH